MATVKTNTGSSKKATAAEVRSHYKAQGYEVRISRDDGRVIYRKPGEAWLEGRYVEEYRIIDGTLMLT